jgi:hypothetical protein
MFPASRRWLALLSLQVACSGPAVTAETVAQVPADDAGAKVVDKAPPTEPDAPVTAAPIDVRIDGWFVHSMHANGADWVALLEAPVSLTEAWGHPRRVVTLYGAKGETRWQRGPSAGRELIDVAVHPSGELTVLEASNDGWHVMRLGRSGAPLGDKQIHSSIERVTHDSGRLVANGEGVFAGVRIEDHSVHAYRAAWDATGFTLGPATLIVPPHFMTPVGLHGGSYDTFGQLSAHYGVFVGVDDDGVGYVGVSHQRLENGAMVRAHAKAFGEVLPTDPDWLDAFVTRVSPRGIRLGTTVVGTPNDEQLYALRAGKHGAYALGRSERWNAEGTGFDALVAHVDAAGTANVRTFDVALGDIAFDVLEQSDGSLIVVGASGYSQNPHGASVSEAANAFARVLRPDGTTRAISVPTSARHNQGRCVLPGQNGKFVLGGMLDGPGTHSADGDPSLLRAKGWFGLYGSG